MLRIKVELYNSILNPEKFKLSINFLIKGSLVSSNKFAIKYKFMQTNLSEDSLSV